MYISKMSRQERLESKIKTCRFIVIQNMQYTIQRKMVYLRLSHLNIAENIKNLNVFKGIIKIQFHDPKKALQFYDDFNFKQQILRRPFNIYLDLELDRSEMKRYFIDGLTEEKQRPLFQAARKFGIFKLYTNYQRFAQQYIMKSNAMLSYCRTQELSSDQFKQLSKKLEKIGLEISLPRSKCIRNQLPQKYESKNPKYKQNQESQKQQDSDKDDNQEISMPKATLNVGTNEFSITFKEKLDEQNTAVIAPYMQGPMNFYPTSSLVKDQKYAHMMLHPEMKKLQAGGVYVDTDMCLQENSQLTIIFGKMDKSMGSVEEIIQNAFDQIEKLNQKSDKIYQLVVPLSILINNPDEYPQLIKKVISLMKLTQNLDVSLRADNVQEWKRALKAFYDVTSEMINEEEIKY